MRNNKIPKLMIYYVKFHIKPILLVMNKFFLNYLKKLIEVYFTIFNLIYLFYIKPDI